VCLPKHRHGRTQNKSLPIRLALIQKNRQKKTGTARQKRLLSETKTFVCTSFTHMYAFDGLFQLTKNSLGRPFSKSTCDSSRFLPPADAFFDSLALTKSVMSNKGLSGVQTMHGTFQSVAGERQKLDALSSIGDEFVPENIRFTRIEQTLVQMQQQFAQFQSMYEHDQAYNKVMRRKEQKASGLSFTKENVHSFFEKEFKHVMDREIDQCIALARLQ
jgi:hypothetical protein